MARRYRYRRSGLFGLLEDLVDDVWDFIDDEILDRGWDSEWDLRRSGRRWFDEDYYDDLYYDDDRSYDEDRYRGRYRNRRGYVSRRRRRDEALDDIARELHHLFSIVRELEKREAADTSEQVPIKAV